MANDTIEAAVVIGAGGHFCPVARMVGRTNRPEGLIVAQEADFVSGPAACTVSGMRPELYFCADLEGYGWCVRKGTTSTWGWDGGKAARFRRMSGASLDWLERSGRAPSVATGARWRGHAYLLAGSVSTPLVDDSVLLIGDAAGLAYPESGEGIRTAVESGLLAARMLLSTRGRRRADLIPYEQTLRAARPASAVSNVLPRGLVRSLGRWLLGNPRFARHVVLDRWFLRSTGQARPVFEKAA